jgi:signal transduction histidine kinase
MALFKDISIRKKLRRITFLISGVLLLVTCAAFFSYEFYSYRKMLRQELSTLGEIIATNSTAALAFDSREDATEILGALKAERHVVQACIYDRDGNLFAYYPANMAPGSFPAKAGPEGFQFISSHLEGFQPVSEGTKRLGTLYIKSDLKAMYERFSRYGIIMALILALSLLLAYLMSRILQKNISKPILALSKTALAISERGDYSVRARKLGHDELGSLTDAFNHMLEEIQDQHRTLNRFNQTLEQKVQERTSELESLNRELESFSYSISHDLRAPLRAINGYMNIFAEDYSDKVDDEGRRLMQIVLKNSQKMGVLIDDLLSFSKLGRKELSKTNFSMKNTVTAIWEDQVRMENNRDIELNMTELPDCYAEKSLIQQVWINLISNALKYSNKKEKTQIWIGAEKKENEVIYFVKDNGAGFDMKYYNKLFGVFQRLHSGEEFEGTGVGLAIVQRIVEKHEGKIWADAKVGEGATFYFSLPCA